MDQPLLDEIDSPEDIKKLNIPQLNQLAQELRNRIIEVMSVNGGHLASSLGSVEIILALHKVFHSPKDKFIWDIGHQTYAHKLITGRKDRFHLVRKHKGLSGFTNPNESPHDHFHAGHAGAAVSTALGVAKNRDMSQRDEYIIPIIGDASLTCGLTYEALNNMQRDLKRFIIILNDNQMSISENVGCITHILSRILSNPTSTRIHQEIDALVSKVPSVGSSLSRQGHKIVESLKNLVSPGAFFKHFGLSYIGPIDGHNIKKLVETLEGVKDFQLAHFGACHHRERAWHAGSGQKSYQLSWGSPVRPPDWQVPTQSHSTRNLSQNFWSTCAQNGADHPSLIAVTPAMSAGSCLDDFMKLFPERCIDVGIAESHSVAYSGGLAFGGKMKVLATLYSTFLQRAFDNVYHDVCLQELPVVFAIDRAGIAGGDGQMANGIYDIGFLNAMPNMVISQPRDGHVLKELLESAFSWGRPAAIRYPNIVTTEPSLPLTKREAGRGEVLVSGQDLLLIGLGHMCQTALEVREKLLECGVNATVLDPIFVKPLDTELLCDLLLTHRYIATIEEHALTCGLGAILNHFLMSHGYSNIQVLTLGVAIGLCQNKAAIKNF